jgi:hypothetical protein
MPWTRAHLEWLHDTGRELTISCGKKVPVFEFKYNTDDDEVMLLWAKHFRNYYCLDKDIPYLKSPDQSNAEYLTLKFPSKSGAGPSIRSGDFSEILVADYLNFVRNYYVPRTRYDRKVIGNESSKGSDVVAFKFDSVAPSVRDRLLVYEVKARLSENKVLNVLQNAINDSSKDTARLADSLNAIKQRLYDKGDQEGVNVIDRFQRNVDLPYKTKFGAGAVISSTSYCEATLADSNAKSHVFYDDLELIVIKGDSLMKLAHQLYERAANEA